MDTELKQMQKLFHARNKIAHPKSITSDIISGGNFPSDGLAFLLNANELENNDSAKNTLKEYIVDNSNYEYPHISEFIVW